MNNIYKYIILGNGNAAINAAEGIRQEDREGSLLMISAEDMPAYSRPMLTKTPLKNYDPEYNIVKRGLWYKDMGIDLMLDTRVLSMDNSSRIVRTNRGDFYYSKCIYALGGYNFLPPIKGNDLPQVKSVRTYKDIYDIKRLCAAARRVVIIGGGVIGLETAWELARYGMEVNVLEVMPRLMPRFLDEESAKILQDSIKSFSVYTGVEILEIGGEGRVQYVRTKDGEFPADFVIVSTGIRANTAIAKAAGIKCDHSVIIDEHCRTYSKDVYACGDCAQYEGVNHALWSQAAMQGTVAGINAAGGNAVLSPVDSSMLINSPEISMFACGDAGKNPLLRYTEEVEENKSPGLFSVNERYARSYEKRFYRDGLLVGAIIVGNLSNMHILKEKILGIKPKEA